MDPNFTNLITAPVFCHKKTHTDTHTNLYAADSFCVEFLVGMMIGSRAQHTFGAH